MPPNCFVIPVDRPSHHATKLFCHPCGQVLISCHQLFCYPCRQALTSCHQTVLSPLWTGPHIMPLNCFVTPVDRFSHHATKLVCHSCGQVLISCHQTGLSPLWTGPHIMPPNCFVTPVDRSSYHATKLISGKKGFTRAVTWNSRMMPTSSAKCCRLLYKPDTAHTKPVCHNVAVPCNAGLGRRLLCVCLERRWGIPVVETLC
jgi:ribosomal protein S27E